MMNACHFLTVAILAGATVQAYEETSVELCNRLSEKALAWVDNEEHYQHANEIVNGIWIGNACAASNHEWLREQGIGFVLNMAHEWEQLFYPPDVYSNYKKIPLYDRWPTTREEEIAMKDALDMAATTIAVWHAMEAHPPNRGGVLVHCNLGISRSTSVIIRFLQRYYRYSYDDALTFIRAQRPAATPHMAFVRILNYENAVRDVIEL